LARAGQGREPFRNYLAGYGSLAEVQDVASARFAPARLRRAKGVAGV
jgi:hypothetical protein